MSTVRFLGSDGKVLSTTHAVKRAPTTYWLGITHCGRKGEYVYGRTVPASEPTCKGCLRALRRDEVLAERLERR